ncbi:MAG: sigma-54-dependent Fis family transcriptional regulator [Candidatus Marinimicrobia bacterium]|nr:sigma-54-dependent Fis family transcriptional regulator [Candidatus Neomarinimicrobiota bacterium]MBL7010665.1 sigma-54-dependent Fis family transcriptional regulator [Candidatus Neomarinimicrobiota bacterium]MBL7030536.1 sigma-54-dependent Fis family transcriptional regulator [Candidatus Neomarinimicrobiota bacterium]
MVKKQKYKVLVIEDDPTIRDGIHTVLKKDGFLVTTADDGETGSLLFREQNPDLVITDLKLPGKSGLHLLHEFLEQKASLPVILISAYGTIDLAVNALKSGAKDFIAKPFSINELRQKVSQTLESNKPVKHPLPRIKDGTTFHGLVGSSEAMRYIYDQVRKVADIGSPVLITGESGTGKELIARAIHNEGPRKGHQFLAVNCGAFTETLLSSELFGHEKGAFTGAIRRHKGIFEQADGGTILLDEIGEISPQMQVKLLRVLQNQTFQRVGGSEEIKTDVRIITATNRDLKKAIGNNAFREDLYYRINVIDIQVPPLRERREDIPDLVTFIANKKCRVLEKPIPKWKPAVLSKIQDYAWPGNIRELENFLERVFIFSNHKTITDADLYFDHLEDGDVKGPLARVLGKTESDLIRSALSKVNGIKQDAARMLGIKTSTLYYKMKKYGISDEK